jgi:hypothetical protein
VGTLLNLFQVCHKSELKIVFLCLYDALHIVSTLPVLHRNSTTPERTISKLKIIKNRLRTTISQEGLEYLMLISCESNTIINNENVIRYFSEFSTVLKNI